MLKIEGTALSQRCGVATATRGAGVRSGDLITKQGELRIVGGRGCMFR